jgi:hypothetical protein
LGYHEGNINFKFLIPPQSTGHEERVIAYRIPIGKPKGGETTSERSGLMQEDNIKMNLKEI